MAQIFTGTDLRSLAVDIMATYTRVVDSGSIKITHITSDQQAVLGIETLPCMIVTEEDKTFKCTSLFTIFKHIAEAAKFEAIFLGKAEIQTNQILSYFELIPGLNEEELVELLNNDLKLRMYLVGFNITAADILAYAHLVNYAQKWHDSDKISNNNVFRWLDLLQHLPGLNEYAEKHNLIVSFPDEGAKQPSKRELKKLAKKQAIKEHKEQAKQDKVLHKQEGREEIKSKDDKHPEQNKDEEEKKADNAIKPSEGKKDKKNKQQNPSKKQSEQPKKEAKVEPVSQLDIRIGKITKIWRHPESDNLYCEEIDIGDEKPRQIASGLQQFVPIEQMENALVLVLANLKPRKLGGFESQGMVLMAGNNDYTYFELPVIPEGCKPGDKVSIKGYDRNPKDVLNQKKFEALAGDLRVDENGIAKYKDAEFVTDKGIIVSTGVRNGKIS